MLLGRCRVDSQSPLPPPGRLDSIEIHGPQAAVDCLRAGPASGQPAVPPPSVFFVPWKWSAGSDTWPITATRGGSTGATSTPINIATSPFVTIYNVFVRPAKNLYPPRRTPHPPSRSLPTSPLPRAVSRTS